MPPIRRFNALLVEGIPGIGKSSLLDALVRRHLDLVATGKVRTLVHLSQAHTMGPLAAAEDDGAPNSEQNREHLERIVAMLERLHESVQGQRQPSAFVLIDTLHLTQCLRPGLLAWLDVAAFDQRLAALGCRLLLLRGATDVVWDRCIKARASGWLTSEYAKRFGRTHDDVHRYFLGEQERFDEMAAESRLPTLVVENNGELQDVIDRAHEHWYGVDSLRLFQRPLGQTPAHELDLLQTLFEDQSTSEPGRRGGPAHR
jgi:thymidylate kinase